MDAVQYKLDVPEAWDKQFQEKLGKEIHRYLDTFFYDGPYDERKMMGELMRAGRGQLNPHFVQKIIHEFLEKNKPL